jgi:hypothetical protein
MFGKKEPIKLDENLIKKVDDDLIVHNMPDQKRLAGNRLLEKAPVSSGFQISAPKNNFKMVGMFIIVGGFIVIGILVYISYSFIIKPASKNTIANPQQSEKVVDNKAVPIPPISIPAEVIDINATTSVVISEPIDLNVSTSTNDLGASLDVLNGQVSEEVIPLLDSDNDGLYDEEELALGLNINMDNSDLDLYTDKIELDGAYNPNGVGKLADNTALIKYDNKDFNFEILYPKNWKLKEASGDNATIFTAPDDSIIQVSVQDNSSGLNIMSWYADAFPGSALTYERIKSGATWDGVMGEDNLNFYLTDKNHQKIYIISYLPIYANRLAYPSLFKALISSIILK